MKSAFKHIFLFSLTLLLAAGCGNNNTSKAEASAQPKLDTTTFTTLFKKLNFDSLLLESKGGSAWDTNWILYGKPLDSTYAFMFPDTMLPDFNFGPGEDQQYAAARFDLDADHEAYLVRHHGEEFPSRVALLIYDKKSRKFLNENLEVVENWGDDGDAREVSSVFRKKGSMLEITLSDEESMNKPNDKTFDTLIQTKSISMYRVERGNISQVSTVELKRDTISRGFLIPQNASDTANYSQN
jgi:hypothetical protein